MKLSTKLIAGFVILVGFTAVIGGVSYLQIAAINGDLEEIADKYVIGAESAAKMQFNADYMAHMLHHYLEQNTDADQEVTTRDKFNAYADAYDAEGSRIVSLLPEFKGDVEAADIYQNEYYTSCMSTTTGIFDRLDTMWALSEGIHENYPAMVSDLETLIAGETDRAMQQNATFLYFYFERQIHMMHHSLEGTSMGATGATRTKFAAAGTNFDVCMAHLENGSSQTALLATIKADQAAFEADVAGQTNGIFDLYDAITALSDTIHANFPLLLTGLADLMAKIDEKVEDAKTRANNTVNTAILIILAITGLAVVVGSIIGFVVVKGLLTPVEHLNKNAAYIAMGNLSSDSLEFSKKAHGLMGETFVSFESMVANLKGIISQVSNAASKVASTSEELAATTEEINASTEEVSATVEHIARGAGQQAEMATKAIDKVSLMSQTVDASLQEIEGTSGLIQDVAGQTNMLALNAAIEAARAGEYGRGFGVVADNVRVLAENSRSSANEIGIITGNIVSNIGGSVLTIQESVQSIASVAEEFSASAEEVSSAVEEMSASMEQMSASAQELAQLSGDLSASVAKFRLD